MRGGTANCSIKISDGKIASPFVKQIDILIAMNKPSMKKFEPAVRPGGLVISNRSIVENWNFREDVRVVEVDATSIADSLGNPKGANIVMLGAFAATGELFDKAVMAKGIEQFFTLKGKDNSRNVINFEKGYEGIIKA
jgi:2-oxoglutarate ferredoxin oxidoreductase subunit gamma